MKKIGIFVSMEWLITARYNWLNLKASSVGLDRVWSHICRAPNAKMQKAYNSTREAKEDTKSRSSTWLIIATYTSKGWIWENVVIMLKG